MSDLAIEYLPIGSLTPYARNARTHSDAQVAQIAASIAEFGWTNPVLIDEAGVIIAGHGRVMAAQQLGIDPVPCIRLAHLTDAQRRAYVLADNRLALNAGWDDELLAQELSALDAGGYDLGLTGFDIDELAKMGVLLGDGAFTAMPALPTGDKSPFQQKTFTLHDDQAAIVDNAVTRARANPRADTGVNENSNGNALALICKQWLEANNG